MRRLLLLLLCGLAGCRVCPCSAALDPAPAPAACPDCPTPAAPPPGLAALWQLALANNPELREAEAELEAARGERVQAGKYPNPNVAYEEESLGTSAGPPGNVHVVVTQKIVTACKRRLDMAVADRAIDVTALARVGRRFEVLTRVRRAYYDAAAAALAVSVNRQVVGGLEETVRLTCQHVEVAKTRPRTDLIRMETLLAEARIELTRSEIALAAAWRVVAAEVGVPCLPPPPEVPALEELPPRWDLCEVADRVQSAHSELRRAAAEVERARLAADRARAEAVPNVQVGGGYNRNFAEHEAGAMVSVQTALPLWDRNQGRIREADARLAQAEAARRTRATHLSRETAEAYGRYQAELQEVERLRGEVLPRSEQSLRGVRKLYRAGSTDVTFADVVQTQQTLNEARRRLVAAQQELWRAVADLQGLMQLDLDEDLTAPCRE